MNPRVKKVRTRANYELEIEFANGELRSYDCGPLLDFGVFKELRDIHYFKQACTKGGTVVWPHEQDICPDTLYEESHRLDAKSKFPLR
jgi:hypothetical protein